MPKELPGFYYDAEKNRYFPYKGPIPGSSSKPKRHPLPPHVYAKQSCPFIRLRQEKLLQMRELCGNIISSSKGKLSFRAEYQKRHASQPLVWKYKGTEVMANMALEHVVTDVTTPHGLMGRDILLSSGGNGSLCLFEIGEAEQEVGQRQFYYKADCVWPPNLDHIARHKQLIGHLGSSYTAMTHMPSDVTCIKVSKKYSLPTDETISKHFVMTTLGSDSAPGSVYLLDLSKPLDFCASAPISFHELAAFRQTLWTADCNSEGGHAVIGTNRGAALLNIETGVSSWVFRCKSDVLSVQLDQSGKLVLCGLRNGGIVTVDTRQKQVKWSTHSSPTISMPSSVCCLASLNLHDQYFLASSMDGSIKLYDSRLIHRHRRAVQSYEGNVNSHTRIELGVDPSNKYVMSGGEDCCLRLWDIKSGELLFKDRFMSSTPSALCWPRNKVLRSRKDGQDYRYGEDHSWGAWVGSTEGIFYMDWL